MSFLSASPTPQHQLTKYSLCLEGDPTVLQTQLLHDHHSMHAGRSHVGKVTLRTFVSITTWIRIKVCINFNSTTWNADDLLLLNRDYCSTVWWWFPWQLSMFPFNHKGKTKSMCFINNSVYVTCTCAIYYWPFSILISALQLVPGEKWGGHGHSQRV